LRLHELLDRRPWEVDVFYVAAMKPSDDQDQGDWVGAAAARRALVAALSAGTVTPSEAMWARAGRAERRDKHQRKRASAVKRSSLADLRAAGAGRKATGR
jgi:hypothetical protein